MMERLMPTNSKTYYKNNLLKVVLRLHAILDYSINCVNAKLGLYMTKLAICEFCRI